MLKQFFRYDYFAMPQTPKLVVEISGETMSIGILIILGLRKHSRLLRANV